jgi:hypothetical protein
VCYTLWFSHPLFRRNVYVIAVETRRQMPCFLQRTFSTEDPMWALWWRFWRRCQPRRGFRSKRSLSDLCIYIMPNKSWCTVHFIKFHQHKVDSSWFEKRRATAHGTTGQRDNGTTGHRANGTTGQRDTGPTGHRANGPTGQRDAGKRPSQPGEPTGQWPRAGKTPRETRMGSTSAPAKQQN